MSDHASSRGSEVTRRRLESERSRLTGLRDELNRSLAGERETSSLQELSSEDQHPADLGTETFNRERDLGTLESLEEELDEVERALERLEQGTYGVCVACGRPIPPERLEALPATPFCVEDSALASAEAAPGVATLGVRKPGDLGDSGRAI